jgi:hypothetical protein
MSAKEDTGPEAFLRAYERRTKGFEIHTQTDSESEGYFSWRPCETCGSKFGGQRYDMVLTNAGPRQERVDVASCLDCLVFAANGELPDTWENSPESRRRRGGGYRR